MGGSSWSWSRLVSNAGSQSIVTSLWNDHIVSSPGHIVTEGLSPRVHVSSWPANMKMISRVEGLSPGDGAVTFLLSDTTRVLVGLEVGAGMCCTARPYTHLAYFASGNRQQ